MPVVKYFVETMKVKEKSQSVFVLFKRIPTKQQLDEYRLKMKEPAESKPVNNIAILDVMSIFHSQCEYRDNELELNFNRVQFSLSFEEVAERKIQIGGIVQLDVPEEIQDIMPVEPNEQ